MVIGDTLTEGWENAGRDVWEHYYAPLHVVNLGVSNDRTQNVLWRLQNGNLSGFTAHPNTSPKVVVVMVGASNADSDQYTAEETAAGIMAVVDEIRARLPKAKVLLLGILPCGKEPDVRREKIAEANRLASPIAEGRMIHFLDVGAKFIQPDGTISTEVMPGCQRLASRGYTLWAEAMEVKLAELLGE